MKKALIVINSFSTNENVIYKARRLKDELEKRNISCDIKKACEIPVVSTGDKVSFPFKEEEYSFCIYLDKDKYLSKALSSCMHLYNSYQSLLLSDDKMSSILELKDTSFSSPLTISSPLCYMDEVDEEKYSSFLLYVEKELNYPLILKLCYGSLGKQVFLIKNRKELFALYREFKKVPLLFEEYICKPIADDYRLIVIGDEVVASMERINENDFRSNISLGGKGFDVTDTIDDKYKVAAVNIAKKLHLDYAGIDLTCDKDSNPLFLEANGNAFFTEIEKVTKVNVASKLIDYILKKEGI